MTVQEILGKVASGEIQANEAATLIDAMKGSKSDGKLSYKVSQKGALSVYGLGRFPITLYRGQWERLDSDDERKKRNEFIKANAAKLATKE